MKKKLLFTLLALVCVLVSVFCFVACKDGKDPNAGGNSDSKDLSQYLGTDAQLSAMTPTDSKYFTFTLLQTQGDEDAAYEVAMNAQLSEAEIMKVKDWVIPAEYNNIKVVQIAKDGFTYFGERNAYDGTYANVYIQPGVERICEGGLYCSDIYILQLPSTLKVIEKNAVQCAVFKAGSGLEVIKSGNEIGFKGYSYGTEEGKYKDNPVCFPDSLEYCDLNFSTDLSKGSGNVKDNSGVYYIGNPNNPYLIAHSYAKVAGEMVTLNKNCKILQKNVFKNYDFDLIVLSDKLTQIGDEAFSGAKITQLQIPSAVKYIGDGAFKNCSTLTSKITLPSNIKSIASNAFTCAEKPNDKIAGNEYGRCVYIGTSQNPYYYLLRANQYDNLNPDTQTEGYEIHEDTKIIAQAAFKDASLVWDSTLSTNNNLNMEEIAQSALSIVVPDGIATIGENAFYNTLHILRGVSLPGNWATLHDDVENPDVAKPLYYYLGRNFSEEDGLTEGKGVASITIREGYTTVADYAFVGLGVLNSLTLPQSIKGSIPTNIFERSYQSGGTFENLSTTVYKAVLPAYIAATGMADRCKVKDLVILNDKNLAVQDSSCRYSNNLESVTISDGIRQLGQSVFDNCKNLKTVVIPASVKSIGYSAFGSCTKLTDIQFAGTKEQWNAIYKGNDWNYATGNYTVHCSDGSISKN